jgi:ATP-dependent Clp protease ATP-binding subunit ClpA
MAHWLPVCLSNLLPSNSLNRPLPSILAAVYAARYISDRFLPDKAIDLVDEAASSLRLAQESKPDALEQLDRAAMTMQIELTSLRNESDPLSIERREDLEQALERTRKDAAALEKQWKAGTSHTPNSDALLRFHPMYG